MNCAVDNGDLGELNLDKKKKKKKKPAVVDLVSIVCHHSCSDWRWITWPVQLHSVSVRTFTSMQDGSEQEAANGGEDAAEAAAEEDGEAGAGLDLSLGKKKKKRKPKARTDEEFGAMAEEAGEPGVDGDKENEEDGLPAVPKLPWEGTDRDYTYQELLGGLPARRDFVDALQGRGAPQ